MRSPEKEIEKWSLSAADAALQNAWGAEMSGTGKHQLEQGEASPFPFKIAKIIRYDYALNPNPDELTLA